jgi:phage shock protein PspC (stress-responsive transcriptional regulator)
MKKLRRLAEGKKIAGICVGLGEYFDVDAVFFRLFFLVSLFFGGIGALIYVLLWIMVPLEPAEEKPRPAPRLHLSAVDKKIAGVCGGLGQWLDVDPVFFRVAFIVLAFMAGFGILLYLAFWLVLPRAPTVARA